MPHSYYSVWVHAVFATKDRKPLIKPEIENHLYGCLIENLAQWIAV